MHRHRRARWRRRRQRRRRRRRLQRRRQLQRRLDQPAGFVRNDGASADGVDEQDAVAAEADVSDETGFEQGSDGVSDGCVDEDAFDDVSVAAADDEACVEGVVADLDVVVAEGGADSADEAHALDAQRRARAEIDPLDPELPAELVAASFARVQARTQRSTLVAHLAGRAPAARVAFEFVVDGKGGSELVAPLLRAPGAEGDGDEEGHAEDDREQLLAHDQRTASGAPDDDDDDDVCADGAACIAATMASTLRTILRINAGS